MAATKLKLAFSALVVTGAAMVFVTQHRTQKELRTENEALAQQVAQLQIYDESLSNRLAATNNTRQLSDEQFMELLKLRGDVGVLRRQLSERTISANQKIQAAEQKLATALSVQAQFTAYETDKADDMKQLAIAMLLYANDSGGLYPNNLDQLANSLPQSLSNWDDADSFDFVNTGVPNAHDEYPQMVVLRERLASQAPDGTWKRIYGFADGRVVTATSYDGNFDDWEKANTHSTPNQ